MRTLKEKITHEFFDSPETTAAFFALIDELKDEWNSKKWQMNNAGRLSLQSYQEAFIVKLSYNSNAIEGSTLTLGDTADVLDGIHVENKAIKEQLAARGIADGHAYVLRQLENGREFSEELIKDIHEHTAIELPFELRGIYRNNPVYIWGSDTVPANPKSVRELMKDLVFAYQNSNCHPL